MNDFLSSLFEDAGISKIISELEPCTAIKNPAPPDGKSNLKGNADQLYGRQETDGNTSGWKVTGGHNSPKGYIGYHDEMAVFLQNCKRSFQNAPLSCTRSPSESDSDIDDVPSNTKKRYLCPEEISTRNKTLGEMTETGRNGSHSISATDGKIKASVAYPLRGPAGLRHFEFITDPVSGDIGGDKWTNCRDDAQFSSWVAAMSILDSGDLELETCRNLDCNSKPSMSSHITNKFNIGIILQNGIPGCFKVDCIVTFVVSLVDLGLSMILILLDKTGKMLGCLQQDALSSFRNEITKGCTLILSEALVYIPIGYKPYLIITKNCIKRILQNDSHDRFKA